MGSTRYATMPASSTATISSDVATGRRMNRRDGFMTIDQRAGVAGGDCGGTGVPVAVAGPVAFGAVGTVPAFLAPPLPAPPLPAPPLLAPPLPPSAPASPPCRRPP